MANKPKIKSRLTTELLAMARDMHASGVMDDAAYENITMRHLAGKESPATAEPLTGAEIKALSKLT